MDFISMMRLDFEIQNYIQYMLDFNFLLYDQRYRSSLSYITNMTLALGLDLNPFYAKNTFLSSNEDDLETMTNLYTAYFALEPKYIQMHNKTFCNLRKESFDQWLESKISFVKRGSRVPCYNESKIQRFKSNKTIVSGEMKILSSLLHNFLISSSIQLPSDSETYIQIPMPLIFENTDFIAITEQWLAIITWWKKVTHELHPLAIKLQMLFDCNVSEIPQRSKKIARAAENLQQLFNECKEQENAIFPKQEQEENTEESQDVVINQNFKDLSIEGIYEANLHKASRKAKQREVFEDILWLSVLVSRHTVSYLLSIQTNQTDHEHNDLVHKTSIAREFRMFHTKIKHCLKKKRHVLSGMVEKYVGQMIHAIGETLKHICKSVSIEVNDEIKRFEHNVKNVRELVQLLLDASNFSASDTLYDYYEISMNRGFVDVILKRYTREVTQISMENMFSNSQVSIKYHQPTECKDSLLIVSPLFFKTLLTTIEHIMDDCMPITRPRGYHGFECFAPIYIIYDDFPKYLSLFPEIFHVCPYPILDLNSLTAGRLLKFMIELLHTFKKNHGNIDQILHLSEEYMKFSERLKRFKAEILF